MALYCIHRQVGKSLTQDDLDAAAVRAIMCAPQFPGLKWHRSYWDREQGRLECYYEANTVRDIQEHARVARIPCDDIRLVDEVNPETYLHG